MRETISERGGLDVWVGGVILLKRNKQIQSQEESLVWLQTFRYGTQLGQEMLKEMVDGEAKEIDSDHIMENLLYHVKTFYF